MLFFDPKDIRHVQNSVPMKRTMVVICYLVLALIFTGCNKTDDGAYTEPITIYEKMGGEWKLTKLVEVDNIAVASSSKPDAINLTAKFSFRTFIIEFKVDEKFQPTTFEVKGEAPELFLKSGYWNLSHPFPNTDGTAVKIQLYSDEAKTQMVDALHIAAVPGSKGTMEFNLIRESNNLPYVTYQYTVKLQ